MQSVRYVQVAFTWMYILPKWGLNPFNDFEVAVMNHLGIAPSQLHLMSWAYVKVFQHWCEYKNNVPTMVFLLHLFHVQRTYDDSENSQGLISLKHSRKMFDFYMDIFKGFKNRYYIIALFNFTAHKSLYNIPKGFIDHSNYSSGYFRPNLRLLLSSTMCG